MFLMHINTGDLIRIDELEQLIDPSSSRIKGRDQAGQEEQESDWYSKDELVFPSGEPLPRCWTDANYRVRRTIPVNPK